MVSLLFMLSVRLGCSLFKIFCVWEGLHAECASPICEHLFDPRAHLLASVCVTMCPRVVVYPSWR